LMRKRGIGGAVSGEKNGYDQESGSLTKPSQR
jgi:hypothetical protein